MGITATAVPPGGGGATHVYLRIDGLQVEAAIATRRSGAAIKQSLEGGVVLPVVPADNPAVAMQVYAYRSAQARSDRAAPVWSMPLRTTLADLGLSAVYTPAELWAAIYAMLRAAYPNSVDDLVARFPA